MSFVNNKYWWLLAVVVLGVINLLNFIEGEFSVGLLFVWLLNLNFLIYFACNDGSLHLKRDAQLWDSRVMASFHYVVCSLKFVGMVVFVVLALTDLLTPQLAWCIMALLVVDTVLMFVAKKWRTVWQEI